jgi:PKD repeat protein
VNGGSVYRIADDKTLELYATIPIGQTGRDLVFDSKGRLYVTSFQLLRRDDVTKQMVPVPPGDLNGDSFGGLWGATLGPDGNVYIADLSGLRIVRFSGDTGKALPGTGKTGATFIDGLPPYPTGIAFGPDGNLYGVGEFNGVWRYKTAANALETVLITDQLGADSSATFGSDGLLYIPVGNRIAVEDVVTTELDALSILPRLNFLSLSGNKSANSVVNIAPPRNATGGYLFFEGNTATFTATFADPSPTSSAAIQYEWKAEKNGLPVGSTLTGTIAGNIPSFNLSGTNLNDEGAYHITLTLTDSFDGKKYSDGVTLIVRNQVPTFELGADTTIAEGTSFPTRAIPITDAPGDNWTVAIDYGDGTKPPPVLLPSGASPGFTLNHVYADNGIYVVTATVTDNDGASSTDSFKVTVTNVSPTLNVVGNQTVAEGTLLNLINLGSFTDPGFDFLNGNPPTNERFTYSINWGDNLPNNGSISTGVATVDQVGSGGAPSVPTSGSFDGSHIYRDNGSYTVHVMVTDDDGGSSADKTFVVTVTNVTPTVIAGNNETITEGTALVHTISFTDPGSDSWTGTVDFGDLSTVLNLTNADLNGKSYTLNHIYANDRSQPYTVTVTVKDKDNPTGSTGTFQVTVTDVAPVITGLAVDQATITEGGSIALSGSFFDPGALDGHKVTVIWGDNQPNDVFTLAAGLNSFANRAHQYRNDGLYSITVKVEDTLNATSFDQLPISVTVVNQAPTFASLSLTPAGTPTTIIEGGSVSLTGNFTDSGLDTWTGSINFGDGLPVVLLDSVELSDKAFTRTHLYNTPGTYDVVTTISDGTGGTVVGSRQVLVTDRSPSNVTVTASQPTVREGLDVFAATGSFSDLSGSDDSWTAVASYDGGLSVPITVNPDKTFSLQHVFPHGSTHTVQVTVTDQFGQQAASLPLNVTVNNVAPVLTVGPDATIVLVSGLALFTRDITFTDPGEDTWSATIDFENDGIVDVQPTAADLSDHLFNISVYYTTLGAKTMKVTLTDGQATDIKTFVVNVVPPNRSPIIGTLTNLTVPEFQPIQFVVPVSDPDGNPVTLSLGAGAPAGAAIDSLTRQLTWTPQEPDARTTPYDITVIASDGSLTDQKTFRVTVTEVNQAPVINAIPNKTVNEESTLTFTIPGSDPDFVDVGGVQQKQALQFSLLNGPTGAAVNQTTGAFTWTPTITQGRLTPYDVTVQVSDGLAVTSRSFQITAVDPLLRVQDVQAGPDQVTVTFNRPVNPNVLNLFDSSTSLPGDDSDLILNTSTGVRVRGSSILDASHRVLTFIPTGAPLAVDHYTLTLRSAADGFTDSQGILLDGNNDGQAGEAATIPVDVLNAASLIVSVPDFARGPGQPVNLPADGAGVPIRVRASAGSQILRSMDFTITYDPALLHITGVTRGSAIQGAIFDGSEVAVDVTTPGIAKFLIALSQDLTVGTTPLDLVSVTADVPLTAASRYRDKQVLSLSNIVAASNTGATLGATADDGLQLVAYLGDTSGDGQYTSLDASLAIRQRLGTDKVLPNFALLDPVLVTDTTGDGAILSLDITHIIRARFGQSSVFIPPLPSGAITLTSVPGPDPTVTLGTSVTGAPGDLVTVPLLIDQAQGIAAGDMLIGFDSNTLQFANVRKGPLIQGDTNADVQAIADASTGTLDIAMPLSGELGPGGGTMVLIDFLIKPTAVAGTTAVDLRSAQFTNLTGSTFTLNPVPVPGTDGTDGQITIVSSARTTLDVDGNGRADALTDGLAIVRYLFGFTGNALTNGVVDPTGTRTSASAIISYLDAARTTMLDVDGNGKVDALTDGLAIVRYLFGFTGSALVNGVIDPAGTRNTAAAVQSFLAGFLPTSSPSAENQVVAANEPVTSSQATTTITTSTSSTTNEPSAPSTLTVDMSTQPATSSTTVDPNISTANYGLAYVQQSWVQDFVSADSIASTTSAEEEELLIALPA